MTASAERLALPALYVRLLDDAAIFPPGNANMPDAVVAHAATLRSPDAAYVGTFLCSSDRLRELQEAGPPQDLALSLVVRGGAEALDPALGAAGRSGLDLRAVEIAVPPGAARGVLEALPRGVQGYIELPLDAALPGAVGLVRDAGGRVKLRTGGVSAHAFPSEAALADGLSTCVRAGVPFKLTAGLHHALRHRDATTGFEHHGFLNVLAAVGRALEGGSTQTLSAVLAERDAPTVARAVASMDDALSAQIRSSFVSFGTCSTTDPLDDLRSLDLIPRKAP